MQSIKVHELAWPCDLISLGSITVRLHGVSQSISKSLPKPLAILGFLAKLEKSNSNSLAYGLANFPNLPSTGRSRAYLRAVGDLPSCCHRVNCRPRLLSRAQMELSPCVSLATQASYRFIYPWRDSKSQLRRRLPCEDWIQIPSRSASWTRTDTVVVAALLPILRYVILDLISVQLHALIWFP